ncbi:helix-turn-helix transcriptional regulator [Marinobacter salinisoli]|uniref:Helix-turn-helix transcriptional regulator n=1 Tax=Marinobacter salinisoli TaxID=2769486 RepID=A0ABX7MXS3_9GAMM|nr:AraC family transcriptional regulator [Marinobacter salinisoli]QSP96230.1 helix-turn-helix transcriptional regulator [Marinobacter salinisoli]
MQRSQNGTLFLWPDHWQLVGRLMPNRPHRHISASWLVGLDGDFQIQVDGHWRASRAVLVAPDVEQSLKPGNTRMWCAQLDPDSDYWRALRHLLGDQRSVDVSGVFQAVAAGSEIGCAEVHEALLNVLQRVGEDPAPLDPRIQQVCDLLRAELPEKIQVGSLAALVGLSSSRLSHLFRQQVGVPLRRFLLHLKVSRVLAHWERGKSLSQLAMDAGFYDQPHFVRTARDMFDALPSEYVTTGWFTVCRCGFSSSP